MIELKGTEPAWFVMEVNGRFWGSLPLTLGAGLDMPFWLTVMHTQPEGLSRIVFPAAPQVSFQRNLKRDAGWLVRSLLTSSRPPEVAWHWIRDWSNLWQGRERIDFLSVRDPLPFLHDWAGLLLKPWERILVRGRRLAVAVLYRTRRRALMAELRHILAEKEANILILCSGNICRSPFAEGCLRQTHGYERVKSVGVHFQENRLTPSDIQQIAMEDHGVDLSGHKSRCLDEGLIEWADIVLVMD